MAKYPNTKILKKARPKTIIATGVVKEWQIEVLFKHIRADGSEWTTSYEHTEDVAYLDKQPSEFTKAELIGFMNSNLDVIFDAHYEAHNTVATDETNDDFDINTLL